MNLLERWEKWWIGRRARRVELLGGKPMTGMNARRGNDIVEFSPPAIAKAEERSEVDGLLAKLGTTAVDEATPHPLDNLINTREDQWLADVHAQYTHFHAQSAYRSGDYTATLRQAEVLRDADARRVAELSSARASVAERILSPGNSGLSPNAALMTGRHWSTVMHVAVLGFAAVADFAAFTTVVEIATPNESALVSQLLVLGFTAVVLYLGHSTGVLLAQVWIERRWASAAGALVCAAVWGVLGYFAWRVRMRSPTTIDDSGGFLSGDSAGQATVDPLASEVSLVFLGLYLGCGVAAAVGAYLAHNSPKAGYRRLIKAHELAVRQLAASTAMVEAELVRIEVQRTHQRIAPDRLREACTDRLAFAAELKQYVRVGIAGRLDNPATTDAVLEEDRRPYDFLALDGVPHRPDVVEGQAEDQGEDRTENDKREGNAG